MATTGTNLKAWPSAGDYVYDTVTPFQASDFAVGDHLTVAASAGFPGGTYAVRALFPAYATGTDGAQNMLQLGLLAAGSGYTAAASSATAGATGGSYAKGDGAPASAPAYPWSEPAPNTALTGPLKVFNHGDSITQYQGARFQAELQKLFPNTQVLVYGDGLPGATLEQSLPGATNSRYPAMVSAINAGSYHVLHTMLGTNDSKRSVATASAQYQTNVQTIVDALYRDCPTLTTQVWDAPPFTVPGSGGGDFDAAANTLQRAYANALDSVSRITAGHGLYGFFAANPTLLVDGVHPTPGDGQNLTAPYPAGDGQAALVSRWATTIAPILSTIPASQPAPPNYNSDPSGWYDIPVNYKHLAPTFTSGVGLGTRAVPKAVMIWTNPDGFTAGDQLLLERRLKNDTAGVISQVATIVAAGTPAVLPTTYTDLTVVNGLIYQYRLTYQPATV